MNKELTRDTSVEELVGVATKLDKIFIALINISYADMFCVSLRLLKHWFRRRQISDDGIQN